jgi:hypothetical protein
MSEAIRIAEKSFDTDGRIAGLQKSLDTARENLKAARDELNLSVLAVEEIGDPLSRERLAQSKAKFDDAMARVRDLEAAMGAATSPDMRRADAQRKKAQQIADREYKAAYDRWKKLAEKVDASVLQLTQDVKEAYAEISTMVQADRSKASDLLTAKQWLGAVINFHLRAVPSIGIAAILTADKATWSQYIAPLNPGDVK